MKNRIFIFLVAIVLSATACNEWLDVKPTTQERASDMFETLEGYQDALIGCYIKMKGQSAYGRDLTVTTVEYLAQHWDIAVSFGETATSAIASAVKGYRYDDDNVKRAFQSIYGNLYNIIVQANTIIEAMPLTGEQAIPDPQMRGLIEAEALAIRAFCHFDILRLFGQVPGGSTQVKLPYTEDVSRNPVKYYTFAEFTGKLEDDLSRAEALLEEYDPFVEYTVGQVNNIGIGSGVARVEERFMMYRQLRLNYWAVKALQARFYLYVGGRESDALAAARTVVDAAVNGKGFALAGTSNISSGYYALPGEGLFMLSNHQLKNYMSALFPGYGGANYTSTNLYMDPEKLETMFGHTLGGNEISNRYNDLWSHDKKNSFGNMCPELRKYYQGDDTGMSGTVLLVYKQLVPMIRLSEMYLIVMELSDDLDELNTLYLDYRKARNFLEREPYDTIAEIKAEIGKEYRCEFFGEGQMFFYYKRNFTTNMLWSAKAMTESDYIVPLPETEFDPNI